MLRSDVYQDSPLISATVPTTSGIVLNSGEVSWICADWNAGDPKITIFSEVDQFNCRTTCILWVCFREGTEIHIIDARYQNMDSNVKHRRVMLESERFVHATGGTVLLGQPDGYLSITPPIATKSG